MKGPMFNKTIVTFGDLFLTTDGDHLCNICLSQKWHPLHSANHMQCSLCNVFLLVICCGLNDRVQGIDLSMR